MTKNPVINDQVWRDLRAKISRLGDRRVRVGVFASAGTEVTGTTLAEIASIHEFGAPKAHIPARPFLRPAFTSDGGAALRGFCERTARALLSEKIDVDKALGLLGLFGANAVKARIRSNTPPELSARTIARKGSTKTLIDTGRMLNAITWVVTP